MNVLLVCGGGMSSSILAENLLKEAKKHGKEDFYIEATGTESVELKMQQKKWDVLLLAPQVNFRKAYLKEKADAHGVPIISIEGILYTPIGTPDLYKKLMETSNK